MARKLLLIIPLLICQLKSFSAIDTANNPIDIKIKVDREYFVSHEKSYYKNEEYDITSDSAKEKRFDITLTIKNTSSKTIYIWLMTCSWSDYFIVNNDYIFKEGEECNNNFPHLVEFKPGQCTEYKTTLIKDIKFDYPPKNTVYGQQVASTKLGLITINDVYKSNEKDIGMANFYTLIRDKSRWSITWSNSLYLLDKKSTSKYFDIYKN